MGISDMYIFSFYSSYIFFSIKNFSLYQIMELRYEIWTIFRITITLLLCEKDNFQVILRVKSQNFLGLRPTPRWGAYSAPKPRAVFKSLNVLRTLRSYSQCPQHLQAGHVPGMGARKQIQLSESLHGRPTQTPLNLYFDQK